MGFMTRVDQATAKVKNKTCIHRGKMASYHYHEVCYCPLCSSWNHALSDNRDYDGDLDGKGQHLDTWKGIAQEAKEVQDEYNFWEEMYKEKTVKKWGE